MSNMLEDLERQELIEKLYKLGYGEIIDAFLENEDKVTTKKGRINKSGFCRVLDCKTKQLEDQLEGMRKALEEDMEED